MSEQKTKEIGIRKVFGAELSGLLYLSIKPFVLLIIGSGILSLPIAYVVVKEWLQTFEYNVGVSVMPFVISLASALIIAVMTIGYITIRAARINPVQSLYHE